MSHSPKLRDVTLLAASSLTVMAGAIISPALPDIARAFGRHGSAEYLVKFILTVPALFIAVGAPLAGWIADRWGRRPLLIATTLLYGVAGGSGYVCDSLYTILVGRALLGLAVAGVMTSCTTLIGDYFEGMARHRFAGLQAVFMALGGVVFVLVGGLLADIGWRMPFLVYLAGFLVLPGILYAIDEPVRLGSANSAAPNEPVSFSTGAVLVVYALAFIGMAAFYLIPVQLPFYVKGGFGASGLGTGMAIATSSLCGAVSAWHNRRLKARFSYPFTFAILLSLQGVGYSIVSAASDYRVLYPGLVVGGLGFGLLLPNLNLWLLSAVPERSRGRLVGGLMGCIFLGQFFSPILVRPIVRHGGLADAFRIVGLFLLALAFALAAFSVFTRRVWSARSEQP